MKLASTPDNRAMLSNVQKSGDFKISASAKAFKILSDSLYSNKIRAIIRELSCNAYDSHVAAGKPNEKFQIHLPTSIEPWFSVKDFGVGLSNDGIINIYTTYFESTKTETNDQVGCLGLGSKTPLSYTDNFTVTTVKDGWCGIYTAFINDEGTPSISLMSEFETSEPNGVEIKVPVKAIDFSKFYSEASDVFSDFKIVPEFIGRSCDLVTRKYIVKDIIPGVHQLERSGYSYNWQWYAIMGNIRYPIDKEFFKEKAGRYERICFEMHFEVGELDIQPSREGLSYDKHTIKAIEDKIDKITDGLYVKMLDLPELKETHPWKISQNLYKLAKNNLFTASVLKYVNLNNFILLDKDNIGYGNCFYKFIEFDTFDDLNIAVKAYRFNSRGNCESIKGDSHYNKTKGIRVMGFNIPVETKTAIVLSDIKIGAQSRSKDYFRDNSDVNCFFVLEPLDKDQPAKYDQFLKLIDSPPQDQIYKPSTFPKKERVVANNKSSSISGQIIVYSSGWLRSEEYPSKFNDTDTYYYIPVSGFSVDHPDIKMTFKEFSNLVIDCRINTINKIYGVRKSLIDDIKKKSNWVNLIDVVKSEIPNLEKEIEKTYVKGNLDFDLYINTLYKFYSSMDKNTKLYNKIKSIEEYIKSDVPANFSNSRFFSIEQLYKIMTGSNIDKTNFNIKIDKLNKEFEALFADKYPLLKHVLITSNRDISTEVVKDINFYINQKEIQLGV